MDPLVLLFYFAGYAAWTGVAWSTVPDIDRHVIVHPVVRDALMAGMVALWPVLVLAMIIRIVNRVIR